MKGRWLWLSLALSLVFALFSFQGCSATNHATFGKGSGTASDDSANSAQATSGNGGAGGGGCLLCNGSGGNGMGVLTISPLSANMTISGGNIPTQKFTAMYNGNDVSSQVGWVVEKVDMATIDKNGLFTPTGNVGGVTKVLALFEMQKAEANVTIDVDKVVAGGVTQAQQDKFNSPAGADPSMQLIYPLDKTVMPLRVLSPEFMWNGGGGADIYRLKLTSKHITYTEFFTGGSSHIIPQAMWENIQFSGGGPVSDPLKVELSRQTGGVAYSPKTITIGIAQGIIYGSVYYWQLPDSCGAGNGKVLRIKPSSEMTDQFYPTTDCFGCHSVSRDGTQMMGTFSTGSPFPMQEIDLTKTPAVLGAIKQGSGVTGVFSAYNNDTTKVAYSDNSSFNTGAQQASIHIIDAKTGQKIVPFAFPQGCGEPAWSPDGTMLAAICGMTGFGWTFDSSTGDLTIGQINKAQNMMGMKQTIVPKGALPGRPAYPTFSPDSKYVAFGRPTSGSRSTDQGTLWMSDVTGKSVVQLKQATFDPMNDNHSYNPVFAPKSAGGYTWIVFISKRNYGNKLVNANRQQLWMTAIADPPDANKDPSNPPFYIRGQQNCDKSENAYYALDPCKKDGEDCEHGIECCNKSCIYDQKVMKHVCKPPEGGMCIPTGSGTCTKDTDCCDFGVSDVKCLNGFCELIPPK